MINNNSVFLYSVILLILFLNGCAATRAVMKMNYDQIDVEPNQVIYAKDGSLAIESKLTWKKKNKHESFEGYVYGSPTIAATTIKKAKKKKMRVRGKKQKVRMVKILVESHNKEGWYILSSESQFPVGLPFQKGNIKGTTIPLKTPFEYQIKNRIFIAQINGVKLDKEISRVPSGRISLGQVILFVPALLFDIVTSPIQLIIYGDMYGGTNIAI